MRIPRQVTNRGNPALVKEVAHRRSTSLVAAKEGTQRKNDAKKKSILASFILRFQGKSLKALAPQIVVQFFKLFGKRQRPNLLRALLLLLTVVCGIASTRRELPPLPVFLG